MSAQIQLSPLNEEPDNRNPVYRVCYQDLSEDWSAASVSDGNSSFFYTQEIKMVTASIRSKGHMKITVNHWTFTKSLMADREREAVAGLAWCPAKILSFKDRMLFYPDALSKVLSWAQTVCFLIILYVGLTHTTCFNRPLWPEHAT